MIPTERVPYFWIIPLILRCVYADNCRYVRYISSSIPGRLIHFNITSYADLGTAKDHCDLIGAACKGVNLKSSGDARQYNLASADGLLYSRNSIAWVKLCPGACEYSIVNNILMGEKFYRKLCPTTTYNKSEKIWGNWLQWGPCSQSCGKLGEQRRYRICQVSLSSNHNCSEDSYEIRVCNYAKRCPDTLNNVFGIFGSEGFRNHGSTPVYSTCIRTEQKNKKACGSDSNAVSREKCTKQLKCCYANDTVFFINGGPRCFLPKHYIASAGLIGWSVWTPWTVCSATCGYGYRSRNRICTGSVPSIVACAGPDKERETCSPGTCPCQINPCQNGGVCRVDDQTTRGYFCICLENYIGKHCDFDTPTLSCGTDSILTTFDRRLIADQGLIDSWQYIHFQKYETRDCFARLSPDLTTYVLSVPPPIDESCGSYVTVTEDSYTISNKVMWKLTDQSASSTVILLDLSCKYNKQLNKTTNLGFGIEPTVRTLAFKTSRVEFNVDMRMFRNQSYSVNSLIQNSPVVAEGEIAVKRLPQVRNDEAMVRFERTVIVAMNSASTHSRDWKVFLLASEILYVLVDLKTISLTNPEHEVLVLESCFATDISDGKKPIYKFIENGVAVPSPTRRTTISANPTVASYDMLGQHLHYSNLVKDKNTEVCNLACSKNPAFTSVLENGISSQGKWAFRVFEWTAVSTTSDINIVCKVFVCDIEYEDCLPSCDKTVIADSSLHVAKELKQSIERSNVVSEIEISNPTTKANFTKRRKRTIRDVDSDSNTKNSKNNPLNVNQNKHNRRLIVSKRIQTGQATLDDSLKRGFMSKFDRAINRRRLSTPNDPPKGVACGWPVLILVGAGSIVAYIVINLAVKKLLASKCGYY